MELPTTIYGPEGALGPNFSFADQVPLPSDIGVHSGGDFDAIQGALAGISYYVDTIGFGSASATSKTLGAPDQKPLGLRYFMKTGMKCSNGEDMYDYISSIPKGDALGKRIGAAIEGSLGVGLKGLGPGMVEDAKSALDPRPIISAVIGDAFPRCKKARMPVGDQNGKLISESGDVWVNPEGIEYEGSQPYQTRWILDKYVDQETYTSEGNGGDSVDGFTSMYAHSWNPLVAGGLVAGLALAVAYTIAKR